jgi:serine/threonine-protein kinase
MADDRTRSLSPLESTPTAVPLPAEHDEMPSQVGRYTIEGEIARGGMGVVFRASDPDFGRTLAVKVLLDHRREDEAACRRFLDEARLCGQLQHPGIPPVHEMGTLPDGRPFFAMKLVKGDTLAALLDRRASTSEDLPRFLAIFEQVCQTVAYAHSRGVLHRDLKPSNVMVGAFGEVQVMDWGLAKLLREPADAAGTDAVEASTLYTTRQPGSPEETAPGSILGTPAFMPPEQARGQTSHLDPRADVFALGGILCVILTGRPPYGGGGPVLKQAQEGDLTQVRTRLTGSGADEELVRLALACLEFEPAKRPRDAGTVAEAVAAHRAAVEERARKAELERAAAEARAEEAKAKVRAEQRSRRLTAGLAAVVLLSVLAGGGVWLWLVQERANREWEELARRGDAEQSANLALGKAEQLTGQAGESRPETVADAEQAVLLWQQAEGLVEQAEGVLASALGGEAARDRLAERRQQVAAGLRQAEAVRDQARKEAKLLADLDQARDLEPNAQSFDFDYKSATRAYEEAVAAYGLDVLAPAPEAVAAVIKKQRPAVRLALIVALEDWAFCAGDRASHLRRVADLADEDAWRRRYRAAVTRGDVGALKRLATEARGQSLPAVSVELLSVALARRGALAEAADLLREARIRHPSEFWFHFNLASYLSGNPFHPDPGTLDEQLGCCWTAVALRPNSAGAHNSLGNALSAKGRLDEAIAAYRKAVALNPRYALAHMNLGGALSQKGQLDDGIACYRKAIAFAPGLPFVHYNFGNALGTAGRMDEAIAEYRKAIAVAPEFAQAHTNLGLALFNKGQVDEAIAHYRKAIAANPRLFQARYNLGNALMATYQPDEAITEYREALAINPRDPDAHGALGEALLRYGRFAEARDATRRALDLLAERDPRRDVATRQLQACEWMLALDEKLPVILKGDARPSDNQERLQFAYLCSSFKEHEKRYLAAVGFFADAFTAEPRLTTILPHRYNAACAAALAAAGQGQDASGLGEEARARLRKQSREWLEADLKAWAGKLDGKPAKVVRDGATASLRHWQTDAKLRGVRHPWSLLRLRADERRQWQQLWDDVDDLLKKASKTGM